MSNAAYSTALTANVSGKCFDFVSETDLPNGYVTAKGEPSDGFFTAAVPAFTDEIFLICAPACEPGSDMPQPGEAAFINKAGKPFRAYGLLAANHDRFGVSENGITAESEIQPGDYITVDGESHKLIDAGTTAPAAASYGFIGRVAAIEDGGLFTVLPDGTMGAAGKTVIIEVIKNETIEAAEAQGD